MGCFLGLLQFSELEKEQDMLFDYFSYMAINVCLMEVVYLVFLDNFSIACLDYSWDPLWFE